MHKLTSVIAKVDAALAEPNTFRKEPAKAAELARMRAEAALALAKVEEDWLAVSGEIEAGS